MSESGVWVLGRGVWATDRCGRAFERRAWARWARHVKGWALRPGWRPPPVSGSRLLLFFLFLLIRAFQHVQDFPPVQVNLHAV